MKEFTDVLIIADAGDRSKATRIEFWDGSVTIARVEIDESLGDAEAECESVDLPWATVEVLAAVVQAASLQPTVRVQ